MKILLAVDGSDASLRATRKLIELATTLKDAPEVELVAVHLAVPRLWEHSAAIVTKDMVDRYYREEGQRMLATSQGLLEAAGIAHRQHVLVGNVAETIVAHAAQTGCAVLCMGSRGMSALSGLVMGSVATKVVHLATVPVLLVP